VDIGVLPASDPHAVAVALLCVSRMVVVNVVDNNGSSLEREKRIGPHHGLVYIFSLIDNQRYLSEFRVQTLRIENYDLFRVLHCLLATDGGQTATSHTCIKGRARPAPLQQQPNLCSYHV